RGDHAAGIRRPARVELGLSADRAVDHGVAGALSAGRAVLAAGSGHPDRATQSRAHGGRYWHCVAGAVSPAVPHVVRTRMAGLPRRDRDFRADDLAPAAVVTDYFRGFAGAL